jgi:hypothetical protein
VQGVEEEVVVGQAKVVDVKTAMAQTKMVNNFIFFVELAKE